MTAEMAMYYSAMLRVGLGENFYQAFDRALEEEEPLSDLTLLLCDCISDVNAVLHILREFILDHTVDEQVVYDLILDDIRSRYTSGKMIRTDVVSTLYNIVYALDKAWEEPWIQWQQLFYDLELWEDGIVSDEVFDECFDAWWDSRTRLNIWELQRKWNEQNNPAKRNSFWNKIRKVFRKE